MPGGSLSPTPLPETSNSPAALLLAGASHSWSPGGDYPQNSPTGKKESSLGGDVKKPGQLTLGWTALHTASLQLPPTLSYPSSFLNFSAWFPALLLVSSLISLGDQSQSPLQVCWERVVSPGDIK